MHFVNDFSQPKNFLVKYDKYVPLLLVKALPPLLTFFADCDRMQKTEVLYYE